MATKIKGGGDRNDGMTKEQSNWEVLQSQLSTCKEGVGYAHTLPPACYASPFVTEIEIERVFRRAWISVGRHDRVSSPGAYCTFEIADTPVIVLRDKKNSLRAFANCCRHRGARLLQGEGTCRAISCPFHCWTYNLNGDLIAAPHMGETREFDKARHGLIELTIDQRAGFTFLCLDPNPPALDAHLGDFEELHAPWPLQSLVTTRRQEMTVNCNWKAFLEVFNEYYHLRYVHPNSIDSLYGTPDPGDATTGAYASQFGQTHGTGALLEDQQDHALPPMPRLKGRWATGARYSWIFPNMTFAAGTDSIWVYEAYPLGPDHCRVHQSICFPPETVARSDFDEKVAHYYRRLDAALTEDIAALENQHAGLKSPLARPGRYSTSMEPNLAHFANWYADILI